MQSLQNTIQTIWKQVRTLSPTARLLIGSLAIIIVMTLFLVAQYTGRRAMEPLGLQANLSPDARTQTLSYLQSRGIEYRESGSDILVPVDQKYTVLAQLTDSEIITPDQINFDTLVQQDSPFLSKAQNDRRWLVATMNVLGRTISNLDGIQRATVLIDDPPNAGGIGRAHLPASASVTVQTRGEELGQSKVDAIAEMVAGAHARLDVSDVRVIDATSGRVFRARDDSVLHASGNLELQLNKERAVRTKLIEHLAYIPGVNVGVNVIVDTRTVVQQTRSFDNPKHGVTAERNRAINSQNTSSGAEPGVRPNTGVAIASSGRRGSSLSDERTEAEMVPAFGGTDARITDGGGHSLLISASVGVPKSYFVRLWQDQSGDQNAQPSQADLNPVIETETERIKAQIEPLIDTRAVDGAVAGTVMVSMIPDFALATAGPGMPDTIPEGGATGGVLSEGLVSTVGLAALALISLAMMFLLVRKATVREKLPSAAELVGMPPALADADSDLVGEAGETSASLEGLEVDEDDIRRQQMLDQINDMARKQPTDAAMLLRRWVKAEA